MQLINREPKGGTVPIFKCTIAFKGKPGGEK